MGTSEEVRSEQQRQRLHAQYPHHDQHLTAPHHHALSPLMTPAAPAQGQAFPSHNNQVGAASSWPHEKLSESDVAHATHAMDIDPIHDDHLHHNDHDNNNNIPHGPASPSPTHYNSNTNTNNHSVFHFGEPAANANVTTFAPGFVATPITRFLTKQTFGFTPKPSFPSPSADAGSAAMPPRSAPSSPKLAALRLPSISATGNANGGNGSLPQSPLASPQGAAAAAFSAPVGDTLSRLFKSASLGNNSAPGTPTHTPTHTPTSRGSTVVLPPLKRACLSPTPTTTPTLPPLASLEDICKPFRYQRSMSCPSDAMARAAAAAASGDLQGELQGDAFTGDAFAGDAFAAPRVVLHHADVPKNRVERSNSLDVSAVLAMREAHHRALHGGAHDASSSSSSSLDFHGWLDRSDRHPLASLAESAHAMQRLEPSRSSATTTTTMNQESPRSLASAHASGDDESANPFDVSDASDVRREKKLCAFPRCASNAVTRGLCISHGGGRRCQRKGCTRGAQSKGLCVAHGGGRICKAKGCSNIQRSMGLCIRHGGGKRCSVPGCQKGVVRQDLCTAHGGKRKCKVEDCNKHVKKKGLCRSHANSVLGAASAVSSPRGGGMSPDYSS